MKTPMIALVLIHLMACSEAPHEALDWNKFSDPDDSATLTEIPDPPEVPDISSFLTGKDEVQEPFYSPYDACWIARPPESSLETAILDRAMQCNRSREEPDRGLLRDMLRYEEDFQVPPEMRGMVLAAACHESGFCPGSEGDHSFSADGRPKAIGILQMWPWWTTSPWGPKIDRRNPRQAARAWIAHVAKQVPKVRRDCNLNRPGQEQQLWKVAWVTAIRKPSVTPRCYQTSKHWDRFIRWRASWEDDLQREQTICTAQNDR